MENNIAATELFETAMDSGDYYFLRDLVQARKQAGRKATSVIYDIARLSIKNRRIIDPEYYFKYRLFDVAGSDDEAMYSFLDAAEYLKLNRDVNFDILKETAVDNKLHMEAIVRAHNIPVVKTQAYITNFNGGPGNSISNRADALKFLRETAVYPLFGKPNWSSRSSGVVGLVQYNKENDTVTFDGKGDVSAEEFVDEVFKQFSEYGFIFQSRLVPHKDLVPLTGNAIGCVRLVTMVRNAEIDPLYAVWKIPADGAIADNFWRGGNKVAAVDETNGLITRIQMGSGVTRNILGLASDDPNTNDEYSIPHWDELLKNCKTAAGLFQHTPIIGWDVAITEDGPVIIEANTNPDHGLYQLAFGTGFAGSIAGEKVQTLAKHNAAIRKSKTKNMKTTVQGQIKEKRRKAVKQGFVVKKQP